MKQDRAYVHDEQDTWNAVDRFDLLHSMCDLLDEDSPGSRERIARSLKQRIDAYCSSDNDLSVCADSSRSRLHPMLLTEASEFSLLDVLKREIAYSSTVYISSAFCSSGAINLLISPMEQLHRSGGEMRILTSCMNHFNDPRDLEHLQRLVGEGNVHIYAPEHDGQMFSDPQSPPPFHVKAYLFEHQDGSRAMIIGSSNLTVSGMMGNIEWNYYSNAEIRSPLDGSGLSQFDRAKDLFLTYWDITSFPVNRRFLDEYGVIWEQRKQQQEGVSVIGIRPLPRESQLGALKQLERMRSLGLKKAAVIAATGLGKTYLAAFDIQSVGAKKVLFIAHREQILLQAQQTFLSVFGSDASCALITGNTPRERRERILAGSRIICISIQTLSRAETLTLVSGFVYDYVVIDEFHHAAAKSYRRVLDTIEPAFLLGLTATPERMDGRDVLALCDHNIAYDVRLFEAIGQQWLTPFQYYAVYDPTDYRDIVWTGTGYDDQQLEAGLSTDMRSEIIIRNLRRYLPSFGKLKALAYCSNVGHALFMTKRFQEAGIPAETVIGSTPETQRSVFLDRLAEESHPLQIICCVDVFNEGVDIPQLTHVLLLRPTLSRTILLQQIGRGLRKYDGKDFTVILDFIGNYRKSYEIQKVLYDTEDIAFLRDSRDSFRLPGLCHAEVDVRVRRIWNEEIRETLRPKTPEEYKSHYLERYMSVRSEREYSLQSMDLFIDEEQHEFDTYDCMKRFGSWLRFKKEVADLTEFERKILDGPGEYLLSHIESSLRPNRTYKMVVLRVLLDAGDSISWDIDSIAADFRDFYISNTIYLDDYPALARYKGEEKEYPLKYVRRHLLNNPLKYLSNKKDDCFLLEVSGNTFRLKDAYVQIWRKEQFRALVRDRVDFVLSRYRRDRLDLAK